MAMIRVDKVIHFGTPEGHTATDWQVALDKDFTIIIDESFNDEVNIKEWHTPLPKVDGDGFYSDEVIIYARVRVHYSELTSRWIELNDAQVTPIYLDDLKTDY